MYRPADFGVNRAGLGRAVDAREHLQCLLIVSGEGQVTRGFGHEEDQQQKCRRGERFAEEHPAPADGDHGGLNGFARVAQLVADQIVHEVDDQHAEDDGELVARDERAADLRGRDFGNVHRTHGRGKSHADTAQNAVDVERRQQRQRRFAVRQDAAFGPPRADGRDEEEHGRRDERAFASQTRGQQARQCTADDAAHQRARCGEAVHPRRVGEVRRTAEELVEGLLGSRHHGRVVTEQQAADDGHQHDRKQIGAAPGFLGFSHKVRYTCSRSLRTAPVCRCAGRVRAGGRSRRPAPA